MNEYIFLNRAHKIMYYIYLIKNHQGNCTYIGYSKNLERRIKEHHGKKPELVYYDAYRSEQDAQARERKLKRRGQTVRRLKERLVNSLI